MDNKGDRFGVGKLYETKTLWMLYPDKMLALLASTLYKQNPDVAISIGPKPDNPYSLQQEKLWPEKLHTSLREVINLYPNRPFMVVSCFHTAILEEEKNAVVFHFLEILGADFSGWILVKEFPYFEEVWSDFRFILGPL